MHPMQQNVTEVVRWCMTSRHENQRQLADALGIAPPTLSLKMAGRRAWSLEDVGALAQHYGVEPRVFLTDPAALVGPELALAGRRVGVSIGTGRKRAIVPTQRGGSVLTLPLRRVHFAEVAA